MSNVLLTGMTAVQVNSVNHDRHPNFPGLLAESLTLQGHTVTWREPSVRWDDKYLRDFDHVIVGIAPLTGLGANRAYGALSVIERLWNDKRLRLLVDAPDPLKMESATQSVVDHPENLVKDFFSFRKEYPIVRHDSALQRRLIKGAQHLNTPDWPTTIVPHLPWQTETQFRRQLPNAGSRIELINLDRLLLDRFAGWQTQLRSDVWAYEKGSHPSWLRQMATTWPQEHLPRTHRRTIWADTMTQLAGSEGCLITPSKSGTWWSPRYAMSLAVRTPVFTDWHETQFLGSAWTYLPSGFEGLNPDQRNYVADEQFASYTKAIEQEEPWTIG